MAQPRNKIPQYVPYVYGSRRTKSLVDDEKAKVREENAELVRQKVSRPKRLELLNKPGRQKITLSMLRTIDEEPRKPGLKVKRASGHPKGSASHLWEHSSSSGTASSVSTHSPCTACSAATGSVSGGSVPSSLRSVSTNSMILGNGLVQQRREWWKPGRLFSVYVCCDHATQIYSDPQSERVAHLLDDWRLKYFLIIQVDEVFCWCAQVQPHTAKSACLEGFTTINFVSTNIAEDTRQNGKLVVRDPSELKIDIRGSVKFFSVHKIQLSAKVSHAGEIGENVSGACFRRQTETVAAEAIQAAIQRSKLEGRSRQDCVHRAFGWREKAKHFFCFGRLFAILQRNDDAAPLPVVFSHAEILNSNICPNGHTTRSLSSRFLVVRKGGNHVTALPVYKYESNSSSGQQNRSHISVLIQGQSEQHPSHRHMGARDPIVVEPGPEGIVLDYRCYVDFAGGVVTVSHRHVACDMGVVSKESMPYLRNYWHEQLTSLTKLHPEDVHTSDDVHEMLPN